MADEPMNPTTPDGEMSKAQLKKLKAKQEKEAYKAVRVHVNYASPHVSRAGIQQEEAWAFVVKMYVPKVVLFKTVFRISFGNTCKGVLSNLS